MSYVFWSLGRALQILALLQVAAALVLGLQTQDALFELKLLLFGALEFIAGYLILRKTGARE